VGEPQEGVEGGVVVFGAPDAVGFDDVGVECVDVGEGEVGQVEAGG
jgi:hypothetical protein